MLGETNSLVRYKIPKKKKLEDKAEDKEDKKTDKKAPPPRRSLRRIDKEEDKKTDKKEDKKTDKKGEESSKTPASGRKRPSLSQSSAGSTSTTPKKGRRKKEPSEWVKQFFSWREIPLVHDTSLEEYLKRDDDHDSFEDRARFDAMDQEAVASGTTMRYYPDHC